MQAYANRRSANDVPRTYRYSGSARLRVHSPRLQYRARPLALHDNCKQPNIHESIVERREPPPRRTSRSAGALTAADQRETDRGQSVPSSAARDRSRPASTRLFPRLHEDTAKNRLDSVLAVRLSQQRLQRRECLHKSSSMSSPTASNTRSHAPPALIPTNARRSFTVPTRTSRAPSAPASTNSSDGIETLFICSSSKIVSFTTATPAPRLSPSRAAQPVGNSAWKSHSERTLAVGALQHVTSTSPFAKCPQVCYASTV